MVENIKGAVKCHLVVRYRTYHEKYLHAICTTPDEAEPRRKAVELQCGDGACGCKPTDKVVVEPAWLNHLFAGKMFS